MFLSRESITLRKTEKNTSQFCKVKFSPGLQIRIEETRTRIQHLKKSWDLDPDLYPGS